MEIMDSRSISTPAKSIGTIVAITGALIATLYQGPPLLMIPSDSNLTLHPLSQSSSWVLGGLLLGIDSAFVLKKYPVELIIMFFYSCFVAVLSLAAYLIPGKKPQCLELKIKDKVVCCYILATFHSLGIVIATIKRVIFLHDTFYLGSLVGSIIIVIRFYSVMWGKAKEMKVVDDSGLNSLEPGNENAPLLIAKDAN